ncbi:MAG TPA: response regulator transcription factor, partial [Candidatus Limnocylindria bacterium]|nr:response regulator transcription factor [Candidatus Limnocylindria bacterium]
MSDTIRVMIVDDERLFAELLRVAMRSAEDIDVVAVAHDVRSALAALDEARPDVVLADYHMPDGTGADLARAVRVAQPNAAIVVLTGDPSAVTLADVARSGAAGHLTKERGFSDVVGAVRAAAAGEVLFSSSELQRLLLS